jgi:phospholipase/carboxylesterase
MSKDSYIYRERQGRSADAPVLFLFHGTGGDEDQFFDLGGQLVPGARLIAVRGDVSEFGALRYFKRAGEGVYDMDDLKLRTEKLSKFIAAQIGETRPAAVLGLGYSNGANILASVMFASPDLFDASVLMHPLIPFTPADAAGLAGKHVLITAGKRDPICPPPLTQTLENYFKSQKADVTTFWHDGGHEIRQDEMAAVQRFLAEYGK